MENDDLKEQINQDLVHSQNALLDLDNAQNSLYDTNPSHFVDYKIKLLANSISHLNQAIYKLNNK